MDSLNLLVKLGFQNRIANKGPSIKVLNQNKTTHVGQNDTESQAGIIVNVNDTRRMSRRKPN